MKKIWSVLLVIVILVAVSSTAVYADAGVSFSRVDSAGGTQTDVLSREIYTAAYDITSSSLGLEKPLDGLTDVCFSKDGRVFLLCGEVSRLIELNPDHTLKRELSVVDGNGENIDFTGAKGIYVTENNEILIADTNNGRVIILNSDGKAIDIWERPVSELVPEDMLYQPVSIIRDAHGYTYVLSLGCYYGALTYSPEGEFMGFYGSNTVNSSALDTLEFLWDKLTGTDAKRASSAKKLPYSFVDFGLDTDGYMVICTGTTESESNGTGQIRKLSPGGSDILYKRAANGDMTTSSTFNFLENKVIKRNVKTYPQNIVSVDVDDSGYIYALDKTVGLIYVYDENCNLIGSFGGGFSKGKRLGMFSTPEAISVLGDSLIVADSKNKSVTVFTLTDYGKLLMTAQTLYLKGEYSEAEPYWKQVMTLDNGNQLSYRGLAMVSYNAGSYDAAINYAKKGLDYSVYDLAYQAKLSESVRSNFALIAAAVILLVGCVVVLFVLNKRRKSVLIKNPKLATAAGVTFHPFQSYEEIKYKKRGSLIIAMVLTVLFYISSELKATASGFLFSNYSPKSYNTLFTLAQTVGLILLWSVANWLIGALFSGKGNLYEIFVSTVYSLIPLIAYTFLRVLLSHVVPLSGMAVMDALYTVVLIYTFFLLSVAMMTVHEYSFFKFLLTGLVTVFAMLLVVFILFMIIIQIQQFGIFISSIFMEVVYR